MKPRVLALVVVSLAVAMAVPADAHRPRRPHARVVVGFDWGIWWHPGWWGPWGYGPGPYRPVGAGTPAEVAVVDTDVSPEHARVYLDGQLIGTADDFDGYPDYLYLEPGTYTLELKLQGYQSETLTLDAKAGLYFPIDTTLKRIPGETAAPWYDRPEGMPVARVFGKETPRAGDAPPRASSEAPAPAEERPTPHADTRLRPDMPGNGPAPSEETKPAEDAALELQVQPANAAIYLDGRFLGTADQLARLERGVAVASGRHTLEVMAPGWTSREVTVEVAPGERKQVVVELDQGTGQNRTEVL